MPPTAQRPPQRRLPPQQRRAQIIGAAREVFTELGVGGTRVREIAARAGITEPLLYRYFHSKQEIVQLAVLDPLDGLLETVTRETHELAARSDIARPEVLRHFHELFLRHVLRMAPLISAVLFSEPATGSRFYQEVLHPRVREVVAQVIVEVSGWPTDSLDLDLATDALLGVYFSIALEDLLDEEVLDPAHLAHQLMLLFAPGLTGERLAGATRARLPVAEFRLAVGHRPDSRTRVPRAERRELVLAAAREVFLESGPSGARSRDIAERAGITEAFLYRLFDSLEEIYAEAVQRPVEQGFAQFAEQVRALGEACRGREFLSALNTLSLSFFHVYGPVTAVVLFSEPAEGRLYYRSRLMPHLADIRTVIVEAVGEAGALDPRVDAETIRRAVIGAQWAIAFDARFRNEPADLDRIGRSLTTLFTGGIRA